jgi:hypothetical protein
MAIVIETRQPDGVHHEHLVASDADIASAIGKLDGEHTTLLTIEVRGAQLFIGGGPDQYTVTTLDGDDSFALLGDGARDDDVSMVIGGQLIDQPARYLVDRATALTAARHFIARGAPSPELRWEAP